MYTFASIDLQHTQTDKHPIHIGRRLEARKGQQVECNHTTQIWIMNYKWIELAAGDESAPVESEFKKNNKNFPIVQ